MSTEENKVIEKLTPEQEKMMPVYVEKYTKLGLSTKPLPQDKSDLNNKINAIYKNGSATEPDVIVYVDSPKEILRALRLFLTSPELNKCPVENYFKDNVLKTGWQDEMVEMYTSLPQDKKDEIQGHIREAMDNFCYGSHDVGWVAFYDFWKTEVGIKGLDQIEPIKAICGDLGWYLPMGNICFVSQNPTEIHITDDKLHNTDGPAISYTDGFKIFAVNGERKNSLMEVMIDGLKENESEQNA